jgi:hypothetical protein
MLGQTFEVMSKPYLDLDGTLNYFSTIEQLQQLIVYSLVRRDPIQPPRQDHLKIFQLGKGFKISHFQHLRRYSTQLLILVVFGKF